jgi:hypothetical protein
MSVMDERISLGAVGRRLGVRGREFRRAGFTRVDVARVRAESLQRRGIASLHRLSSAADDRFAAKLAEWMRPSSPRRAVTREQPRIA